MPGTDQEAVTVMTDSRIVGKAVAQFVADLKGSLKSGVAFVEAIAVAQAALKDIVPILPTIQSVPTDWAANPGADLTTAMLTAIDVYNAITK